MEDYVSKKDFESLKTEFYQHKHLGSDKTQSLSTKTSYGAKVASAATGTLPTGWTVSKNGANLYTLTHNLGTTNFGFVAYPYSISLVPSLQTKTTSTVTIDFENSVGTAFATDWEFILTLT